MITYADIVAAVKANGGNVAGTARQLGIPRIRARRAMELADGYEMDELPSRHRSVEDLIKAREEEFERYKNYEDSRNCIPIKVKSDLPIAIFHFGDPHIDNPGCDIKRLFDHVRIVNETEGMHAAGVGDHTDNWVGRLRGIYGASTTTEAEAWKLAEHFVRSTRWMYMIAGNHDLWSGEGDPMKWITKRAGGPYEAHSMRIELQFPNGRICRINARHDFKGRSEINDVHAQMKAAKMGFADHILISGHRHISADGTAMNPDPTTGIDGGRISHCIQVASYKIYDDYGKSLGLYNKNISPCAVTVIDPRATTELGFIARTFDPELGADILKIKRAKYGVK